MRKIVLCCGGAKCPEVTFDKGEVTIGEKDNLVKLKDEEWNLLVDKIKSGELSTI